MSEPSSGIVCDEGISSSGSSMFISLPDVSTQQNDSAEDLLVPRDHVVDPSTAYGTISTSSESRDHGRYCCKLSFRDLTERLCLSFAIFVVVILFSVPVAYRFVKIGTERHHNQTSQELACSNISWGTIPQRQHNAATTYKGDICKDQLSFWQSCVSDKTNSVIDICNLSSETEKEAKAKNFRAKIERFATDKCIEIAMIATCQYIFPLCDIKTGQLYTLSQEVCLHIEEECKLEYHIVKSLHLAVLPDCFSLPKANSTRKIPSPKNYTNITCAPQFFLDNDTCLAKCPNWSQDGPVLSKTEKIIAIISQSMALTAGGIHLLVSIFSYKATYSFPSVYLLLSSVAACSIASFSLITVFNVKGFMCSSKDVITSLLQPTTYCTVQGAVLHYLFVEFAVLWFAYVCFIFYKVVFPFNYKKMENKSLKHIHSAVLIIAAIFPLPGVVVGVIGPQDKFGYTPNHFPPNVCTSQSMDLWFYSAMLPIAVMVAAATSMLVVILWVVHKYQGIIRPVTSSRLNKLTLAQKKMLFLVLVYIVIGSIVLAGFASDTDGEMYLRQYIDYFHNQSYGCSKETCEKSHHDPTWKGCLSLMEYFLVGTIPVTILTFGVNWKVVFKTLRQCCLRILC